MKDIMLDLETLGTGPGCAIVSIGAVAFDEFGVAEIGFYRACHVSDWETPGYCEQQKLLKLRRLQPQLKLLRQKHQLKLQLLTLNLICLGDKPKPLINWQ